MPGRRTGAQSASIQIAPPHCETSARPAYSPDSAGWRDIHHLHQRQISRIEVKDFEFSRRLDRKELALRAASTALRLPQRHVYAGAATISFWCEKVSCAPRDACDLATRAVVNFIAARPNSHRRVENHSCLVAALLLRTPRHTLSILTPRRLAMPCPLIQRKPGQLRGTAFNNRPHEFSGDSAPRA